MKAVLIVFLALLLVSSPRLRGDENSLSVASIHEKEAISFGVSTWRVAPAAGNNAPNQFPGLMIFNVTIRSFPKPTATIVLQISDVTTSNAEKIWGHKTDENIEKTLSPEDIAYLDSFFARYQAKGEVDPTKPEVASHGWMSFELRHDGTETGDRSFVKKQCYVLDPKLDAEFIRKIIGLKLRMTGG
jgi:hypothetical protein